ncbi:MAG TPA: hypothetical protein ENL34_06640 [Chloroflexi bacterium]|nr:hypothetical protein [Chloroflexota bacterium]
MGSLKSRMIRQVLRGLSSEEALNLAAEFGREWITRLSPQERAAFLSRLVEENLNAALEGLDREQRALLMNQLLPVLMRHFPLADLDFLGALSQLSKTSEGEAQP